MDEELSKASAGNIEGNLHVDRYLTNYSSRFVLDERTFIAQRASTVIPVQHQSDIYVVYDRGSFWRDDVQPRPLNGHPSQVSYKFEDQTYRAVEYALEHLIDDRQRANAESLISLDENASVLLTQKHMIKRDRVWAERFFKTNVWTHEWTGVGSGAGSNQFLRFDDANSDPIGTIDEAKDYLNVLTGYMPNTLVLGAKVKRFLRTHPDVADRIKYTRVGLADEDIMSSLFEIENVMTARSIYNAAAEGAADDFRYITNANAMWLGYIAPTPTMSAPTAIATFAWTGLIPGATNAIGGVLERGRIPRAHSDYFQYRMAWDMQQVAPDLGMYFEGVVS